MNSEIAVNVKKSAQLSRAWRTYFWGTVFLLPTVTIFCVFMWRPILLGIYYSFFNINFVQGNSFVGLGNYRAVFQDPLYLLSVKNTLYYVFLCLIIGFMIPSIVAIAISELRWFKGTSRLLIYLPNIVPAVVLYGMWIWLYDPIGPVNRLLSLLHIDRVNWLTDPGISMVSIVIMNTWQGFGATALIYLAAVVGIPKDLYEAAEIDGAGVWQRIIYITIPSIKHVYILLLIMQLIGTMQSFETHLAMTDGGPVNSTLIYMLNVYKEAFLNYNFGKASAMGTLMFVVLTTLSILVFRLQRKGGRTE